MMNKSTTMSCHGEAWKNGNVHKIRWYSNITHNIAHLNKQIHEYLKDSTIIVAFGSFYSTNSTIVGYKQH